MSRLPTDGPNADQIAYWNSESGAKWVRNHDAMERMLAPVGELLISAAAPASGEAILDVGCGCGGTTFAASALAGPGAEVVGVDVSAPMLDLARSRASQGGPRFVLADAETHAFSPARFDLVMSRFGVMFFADPPAAFTNLRGAMKPGGRLAFACWQPLKENSWVTVPMAAALPHLPPMDPPDPNAPGPFAFADPGRVRDILRTAGFAAVSVAPHKVGMRLAGPGADVLDKAVHHVIDIGPLSRHLQAVEASDAQRQAVRSAVRDALAPFAKPDGLALEGAVWIAAARA